jgi:hypothetical protein
MILPNNSPNLPHSLFKGVNILDFNKPNIKKMNEITIDQILNSSELKKGHKPIVKNTIKKTIPKLLFELCIVFIKIGK